MSTIPEWLLWFIVGANLFWFALMILNARTILYYQNKWRDEVRQRERAERERDFFKQLTHKP